MSKTRLNCIDSIAVCTACLFCQGNPIFQEYLNFKKALTDMEHCRQLFQFNATLQLSVILQFNTLCNLIHQSLAKYELVIFHPPISDCLYTIMQTL